MPGTELQNLRWGRIWRGVEAAVREANPRQSPWLSGRFGRRVFGFGPDDDTDPGYAVVQVPAGYRVDAGSLAGVTVDAEIGVYAADPPAFPPLDSGEDLAARKGTIRVVRAERASSEAVAVAPFVLPEAPRGRLVRSGRDARLRVALAPDDAGLAAQLAASPLIELVEPEQAELTLARRADGGWALVDDVHGTGQTADEPVLAVIPADRLDTARAAVEHYHAYSAPLRMARACRDLPSLLRLWLLDCGDAALAAEAAQDPDLPQVQPGAHAPYEIDCRRPRLLRRRECRRGGAVGRAVRLRRQRPGAAARREARAAAGQARLLVRRHAGQSVHRGLARRPPGGRRPHRGHRHHPARRLAAIPRAPPDLRRDPRPAIRGAVAASRDLGGERSRPRRAGPRR